MEKFPILISYAYLRKAAPAVIEWWTSQPDIEVLLDSGAFTAWSTGKPIQVEDYIAFLKDWGYGFWNYFALDVIKEPEPTRRNLYKMWDAGLKPVPVHVFGEGEAWMNNLYRHTDYIAIVIRQQMGDKARYIQRILKLKTKWAAGRKVHWFGYTEPSLIAKYKPFSCDSSYWLDCVRYGNMYVYTGRGQWKRYKYQWIKAHLIDKCVSSILAEAGYSKEDQFNPLMWRASTSKGIPRERHMAYQITIISYIKYIQDIMMQFNTRHFLATTPCGDDALHLVRQFRCLEVLDVPWKGASNESSSTSVRRTGQHGTHLPSGEGKTRGGLRIVRRLRSATRTGAQFRQEGLLDVGDSD